MIQILRVNLFSRGHSERKYSGWLAVLADNLKGKTFISKKKNKRKKGGGETD